MAPRRSIDLRLLTYFHRTAELGNITRAALALNVAQPTLSKALQQLEHQLGAVLFERHAHGVTLTEIGRRLQRHAQVIMVQVGDAAEDVHSLRDGRAGKVRIGAGPSWVRRLLPLAVARATTAHPGLTVTVSSGFDEGLLDGLASGNLDFVVAERPLAEPDLAFDYEGLTEDHLVVCGRQGHPLAGRRHVTLAQLLAATWALPDADTLARRKLDGSLIRHGVPAPRPVVTSSSQSFLLSFARETDALLYTTRSLLDTPEGSGIVEIDAPDLTTVREAGLIFRKPRLLTPAAEHVIALLRAICHEAKTN